MDASKRKELLSNYKNRQTTAGIYYICCNGNQRKWLRWTTDIIGAKNRYEFAVNINSSPEPSMRDDWLKYGISSFSFIVLEEMTKEETQTSEDFVSLLKLAYEIWLEKLNSEGI